MKWKTFSLFKIKTFKLQYQSAVDSDGKETGYPSVLMTKLDGDVVLEPEDFASWTKGLANALALIHTVDATEFPRTYSPYTNKDEIAVPIWSSVSEEWEASGSCCERHSSYYETDVHSS